jgi:hypothetical protein
VAALSTSTKAKMGYKGAKTMAKHPKATRRGLRAGYKLAAPVAKRRVRRRVGSVGETSRDIVQVVGIYGPMLVRELGLVEPPKPKRTAPRFVAGFLVGASAVYFLEPEHGGEHREKVQRLIS